MRVDKKSRRRDLGLAMLCLGIGAVCGTVALSFADGDLSTSTVLSTNLRIPYKGVLRLDGEPLNAPSAGIKMRFALYDSETSQTVRWQEEQLVRVNAGVFLVSLGAVTPLDATVYDAEKMWLGVTVVDASSGSEVEIALAGRQEIVPAPWAVWSANSADFNVDGTLTVEGATTFRSGATFRQDATLRENVSVGGFVLWSGGAEVTGDLTVATTARHSFLGTLQGRLSLGPAGLEMQDANNRAWTLAGVDAINDTTGLELRPSADPGNGEPLFRVLSQSGAERLRVEHGGRLYIDNALRALGTVTLGDGAGGDTVTINGDLAINGTWSDISMGTGDADASVTVTGGSRTSESDTTDWSGGARNCGLTRVQIDRHRSNDMSGCQAFNSFGWKVRAEMSGRNNHQVDCSMRCMNW